MKGLFRSTVAACLLAGVVWVSSGFAVVSGEKSVAKPGGVCGKAVATAVTKSVSLVCKKVASGKLVWRAVKASSVTPVANEVMTSSASVTTAPRVVSAASATGNAVITIADMSPDTGVYAVQWVPSGQDFNSYQMYRTTTKTMTVPYLSCTRTYTLRVFVMQVNWQLSDGFVNQNVTPHSATFDLTMPACRDAATTSTVSVLTCAQGGSCAIGDTGPGGGVVFILASTTGNTTGRTFEAARNDWDGSAPDGTASWCVASNTNIAGLGTAIGTGSTNSSTIASTCTSTGTNDAAEYVRSKTIGGKSDWFLPSKDEATEMYAQRAVFVGNYSFNSTTVDTARYLTSSQGTNALNSLLFYMQGSSFPGQTQDGAKNFGFSVRPVRAFG